MFIIWNIPPVWLWWNNCCNLVLKHYQQLTKVFTRCLCRSQGVTEVLCEACDQLGWKTPTKIQVEAIPVALQGEWHVSGNWVYQRRNAADVTVFFFCVRVPVPQCTSTPLVLRAQRYRSKHTHMRTHNYQLHVPDYAEVLALSALHQYITLLYCYHRYIKHLSCIAML